MISLPLLTFDVTLRDNTIIKIGYAYMYEDANMVRFDIYNSKTNYLTTIWYPQGAIKKVVISDTAVLPTDCSNNNSPTDGETDISLTPTLEWSPVSYATKYVLYLGTDNPPESTIGTFSGLSCVIRDSIKLEYETTYTGILYLKMKADKLQIVILI